MISLFHKLITSDNRFVKFANKLSCLPHTIFDMIKLVWDSQPLIFCGLVLLTITQGILPVAGSWITKTIFDLLGMILKNGSSEQLLKHILIILILQSLIWVFSMIIGPIDHYLTSELDRHLSLKVQVSALRKIGGFAGVSYFENPGFFKTLQLANLGALSGPTTTLYSLSRIFQGVITIVGFVGVLIVLNPFLAIIIILSSTPHIYVQLKLSYQHYNLSASTNYYQRLVGYYSNTLTNPSYVKDICIFNLGNFFIHKFQDAYQSLFNSQRTQAKNELKLQTWLNTFSGVFSSSAFVYVVFQNIKGNISLGDITLFTSAITSFTNAFTSVIIAFGQINEKSLFFNEYKKLLSLPQPIYIADKPIPIRNLSNKISFQNLSFRYSENHPWVLKDISFEIPKGKCLAIVGLNGAGKTTLVKLIMRLYDPTGGEILWDNINIKGFELNKFREKIGVVLQDFSHFDLTVQENIGIGNLAKLHDMSCIRNAANYVGIDKTIEELPKGYQTTLSRWLNNENDIGMDLSIGEWQKLAIARALIRENELLILDEPSASLDAQTESELFENFKKMVPKKTCILISHRFNTVRMADMIVVLENGYLTEIGTHLELVNKKGKYWNLYQMQAESFMKK